MAIQVELKIDPKCAEPKIVVVAAEMTEEIEALLKRLSGQKAQMITEQKEGKLEILGQAELIRFFAQGGKVFASTRRGLDDMGDRALEYCPADGGLSFCHQPCHAAHRLPALLDAAQPGGLFNLLWHLPAHLYGHMAGQLFRHPAQHPENERKAEIAAKGSAEKSCHAKRKAGSGAGFKNDWQQSGS